MYLFLRAHQQTKIFQWQFLTFKKYFTSTNCELFTAIREAVLVDSISASHRKATSEGTMVPKYPNWGCSPSNGYSWFIYGGDPNYLLYLRWSSKYSQQQPSATSPVSSLRKPLAIRQFGVNSLQELLNMIKDTMEILSSFLGVFLFFCVTKFFIASFRDVFFKDKERQRRVVGRLGIWIILIGWWEAPGKKSSSSYFFKVARFIRRSHQRGKCIASEKELRAALPLLWSCHGICRGWKQ